MRNATVYRASIGLSAAMLLLLFASQIASAQTNQSNKPGKPFPLQSGPPKEMKGPKKTPIPVSSEKLLDKEIDIPELPRYPGKLTFVSGLEYGESDWTNKGFKINYRVKKDKPEQIIAWYVNALPGSGLTIVTHGNDFVQAKNPRSGDQVHVTAALISKDFSNLIVYYTYSKSLTQH